MPILAVSKQYTNGKEKLTNISRNTSATNLSTRPEFQSSSYAENVSKKTKIGVFLTTLAGIAIPMAMILKKKGLSINPLKTSLKECGLFKVNYGEGELEKLVTKLAFGSVGGGLIGGAIFDKKENMKAKIREAIIQLVGNIFTPLICVSGGMKMFAKIEPYISKIMPKIKETAKHAETLNRISKGLPGVVAAGVCLLTGVLLGNKVGNTINKKAFKVDDNRKIKMCDMSPHIDDLCLATSLVAANSAIGPVIKRIIPAALMVAGVSTGITQERPERLGCK